MSRPFDLACARCGKMMVRTPTSAPDGKAVCRPCRLERRGWDHTVGPNLPCADCGKMMHRTPQSLPDGQARCQPCRRANPVRKPARQWDNACIDCGRPCLNIAKRCKICNNTHRRIRAADDAADRYWMRQWAAPGLNSYRRRQLLQLWIKKHKPCVYCGGLAETVDHVVPLVRGGTNHEGNLAPCCKTCNSSKSGLMLIEWRTGERVHAMTDVLPWVYMERRKRKPPQPKVNGVQTQLQTCPICKSLHYETTLCCSKPCTTERQRRYVRDLYRAQHGLPVNPDEPTSIWIRSKRRGWYGGSARRHSQEARLF